MEVFVLLGLNFFIDFPLKKKERHFVLSNNKKYIPERTQINNSSKK